MTKVILYLPLEPVAQTFSYYSSSGSIHSFKYFTAESVSVCAGAADTHKQARRLLIKDFVPCSFPHLDGFLCEREQGVGCLNRDFLWLIEDEHEARF